MKKRVKKKHEHRYWLRNTKERRVIWQEFLDSFTRKLAPEEIVNINDYTTPLEPVKPRNLVKAEVVTLEEQENE